MNPRTRLLTALTLAGLVVLAAATSGPWHLDLPLGDTTPIQPTALTLPSATLPSQAPPDNPPTDTTADGEGIALLTTLLLLTFAALLAYAIARRLRTLLRTGDDTDPDTLDPGTTTPPDTDTPDLPALADAATHALHHLDHPTPPRDAVVAAWVTLEDAAAHHGTPRDPAQTPTEFTTTLLARTPAPPTAVTTLRTLYQLARFTDQPITPHQIDQARTALHEIAHTLREHP